MMTRPLGDDPKVAERVRLPIDEQRLPMKTAVSTAQAPSSIRADAIDTLGSDLVGLIDARQFDQATHLLLGHVRAAFAQDPATVGETIDRLPPEALDLHPALRAIAVFPGAGAQTLVPTGTGAPPREVNGLSEDERDCYHLSRVIALRMRSEFAKAKEVATWLRPRLRNASSRHTRSERHVLAGMLTQLGLAELLAGDIDQAVSDFEEAATLPVAPAKAVFTSDALVYAAVVHAMMGRLRLAESTVAQARLLATRNGRHLGRIRDREQLVRAVVAVERMSADAEKLLRTMDVRHGDELWPVRLLTRGRWDIARGNPAGALDDAGLALRIHPVPAGSLAAEVAAALRLDAGTALGLSTTAETVDEATGPMTMLARARRQLVEAARARHVARDVAADMRVGPSLRVEAMLLASWSHEQLTGKPDAALVSSAGALMTAEGLWRPLALVPARYAGLVGGSEAEVRSIVHEPAARIVLSRRERDVLRRLASPGSFEQIAQEQHVSVNTIKTQVRSIYRRLDVSSRDEAIIAAATQGLFDAEQQSPH
ncbi:MAG: LuxR C-terminal-related transcriptional regulator [Microbacterium sp.]